MNDFLPPREIIPLLLVIAAMAASIAWLTASTEVKDGHLRWIDSDKLPPPPHMPPRFVTPWGLATLFIIVSLAGAFGAYDKTPVRHMDGVERSDAAR